MHLKSTVPARSAAELLEPETCRVRSTPLRQTATAPVGLKIRATDHNTTRPSASQVKMQRINSAMYLEHISTV